MRLQVVADQAAASTPATPAIAAKEGRRCGRSRRRAVEGVEMRTFGEKNVAAEATPRTYLPARAGVRRQRPRRGCMCPIPAARPPAARRLLSCLQYLGAWLARDTSSSALEPSWSPCALSAHSRHWVTLPRGPAAGLGEGGSLSDGRALPSRREDASALGVTSPCRCGVIWAHSGEAGIRVGLALSRSSRLRAVQEDGGCGCACFFGAELVALGELEGGHDRAGEERS